MQNEKTRGLWPTDSDLAKNVGSLLMRYLVDDDRAAPQFKPKRYDKKRDRTYEASWNPHVYEDKKAKLRPFTQALLERHFYANDPLHLLGAYSIDAEGWCKSAAIDIDGSSHAADDDDLSVSSADSRASDQLDAVLEVLRAAGARPLVATSKSGTGYHVRLLFEGRVRAEDARALLLAVARVAGLPPATEVYPKQDSKGEGWGNLLALPGSHWYNAKSLEERRRCASWLVDAESLQPVPFAEWPALIERGCDHLDGDRFLAVAEALYALGEERQGQSPYDAPSAARAASPAPGSNRSPGDSPLSDFAWTPAKMEGFLGDSGAKFEKKAGGSGQWEHRWVLEACPFAADHSGDDASGSAVFMDASGKIGFKCHHAHCSDKTWKDARAKLNPTWKSDPYAGAEYRPIPLIKRSPIVKKFQAAAAAVVAAVCLASGTMSAMAHGAPPAAPPAAVARPEAPPAPKLKPKFAIPQHLLEDEPRWDVIGLDGEVERPDVDDLVAADILASDGPPAEDEPCLWPMVEPARLSLFPAENRAVGWTGVPLGREAPPPRMREPGEDEWEVGGEQRRAERIKKLAAEKLAKKKRPRWSWKTKEYARERMQEEKDQVWHGFRDDMEYSNEADRAKTVKFAVRGLRSFMKALSCAEFAVAMLGNRGTNKVRPCFCENGKLCFFCAEDEAKYKGMYALEHWAPGRYTWISLAHFDDPSDYSNIKNNRDVTSKAVDKVCGKKTARRYYEGYRNVGMVIPGEEAYDAIRAAALPKCPLPDGAPRDKFSWDMTYCKTGAVESLTREEVVERVYGPTGIWLEPSTKFFKDGMVVCRLLSDNLMDEDERRVKLDAAWLKMRNNCYVYTHKAKRTAARKGGKEAMPIMPDSEYPAWRRLKVLEQKMRDDPDYVPSDEEFKIVGLLFRGKTIAAVPDSVEAPWERAGIVKSVHESVLDNLGKPDYTPEKLAERFERGRRAAAEPQQAPQPRGSRRSGIVKLMGTVETIAYEAAARGSAAFSFAPAG